MDAEFLAGINALIDRVETLEKKLRAVDPDALKEANSVADRLVRERAQAKSERELYGSEAAILADKMNVQRDAIREETEKSLATIRNTAAVSKSRMELQFDQAAEIQALVEQARVYNEETRQMGETLRERQQNYMTHVDQLQTELAEFGAVQYIDKQLQQRERVVFDQKHSEEVQRQLRVLMVGGNPEA